MTKPRTCSKCGKPLPGPGEPCSHCALVQSLENTGEKTLGPGFLDDLPIPGDTHIIADKYRILSVIGRGSFGVVYRACQENLEREVAVKTLRDGAFADASERDLFLREAKAIAQLNHPNIVAIYDWGEDRGHPFFSMELVNGESLAQRARGKPLAPSEAARIMQSVASAIDAVHQQGLLHRDIKPANILLNQSGSPKITDFGLAKRTRGDVSHTLPGHVLGSPGYMSPEQASGIIGTVGPSSDIYGLGATLYFLLTGQAPFVFDSIPATLRAVVETEPISPGKLNPAIPRDLECICLKCLEKLPGHRYATAQQLADDLARFARKDPVEARTTTPPFRAGRWSRKHPVLAALTVTLALALLAGGAYLAVSRKTPEQVARVTPPPLPEPQPSSTTTHAKPAPVAKPETPVAPGPTSAEKIAPATAPADTTPKRLGYNARKIIDLLKADRLTEARQALRKYDEAPLDPTEHKLLRAAFRIAEADTFVHNPFDSTATALVQELNTLLSADPTWNKATGDFLFDFINTRLTATGSARQSLLPGGDSLFLTPDARYTNPAEPHNPYNGVALGSLSGCDEKTATACHELLRKRHSLHDLLLPGRWKELLALAIELNPSVVRLWDGRMKNPVEAFEKAGLPSSALLVKKTWMQLRTISPTETSRETLRGLSLLVATPGKNDPRHLAVALGYWYDAASTAAELKRPEVQELLKTMLRTLSNRSAQYEAVAIAVHAGLEESVKVAAAQPSAPAAGADAQPLMEEANRTTDPKQRRILIERAAMLGDPVAMAELKAIYNNPRRQKNADSSTTTAAPATGSAKPANPYDNPTPGLADNSFASIAGPAKAKEAEVEPASSATESGGDPTPLPSKSLRPIDRKLSEALTKNGLPHLLPKIPAAQINKP